MDNLIKHINEDYGNGLLTEQERDKLVLTSLFHKLVYDPSTSDNEKKSAEIFYRFCGEKHNLDLVEVKQMIIDTETRIPCTPLSQRFLDYQMSICSESFEDLVSWEEGLREEYYFMSLDEYKKHRIKFLESCLEQFPTNIDNLLDLINWIKTNY